MRALGVEKQRASILRIDVLSMRTFFEHQSVRAAGVNERIVKVFRRPGSHISRTKAQQAMTLSLHGGRSENVRISVRESGRE